jgi:Spy/CpxP family protein refolding chaperone
MIALVALGACLAGCVSDLGAASNAPDQQAMRYYGGPKYPMWRAPAEN